MMRPKVAFVCNKTPFPTRGGLDLRIESICRALSRVSDVTLICLNGESNFKPDYCEKVIAGSLNIDFPNYEIIKWQKNNPLDPLGIFVTPEAVDFLRSALKSVKAQHIFVSRVATWRVFAELSDEFQVTKHLDLDETSNRLVASFESSSFPSAELQFIINYHRSIKYYEEKILSDIQSIIVSSDLEKQDLETNYKVDKNRCRVIKNTLAVKGSEADSHNQDKRRALFPGNFSYPPNRVAMREIVEKIAPQLPNVEFIIAGSNISKPRELHTNNVKLISNPGPMGDLFKKASFLIAPLRFGAGTRYKIIEAMFYQLPIVATGFAVEGLGLEPGRHYLKAETDREFVFQIQELMKNRELRNELVSAAYDLAKFSFSIEAIEGDLKQIIV